MIDDWKFGVEIESYVYPGRRDFEDVIVELSERLNKAGLSCCQMEIDDEKCISYFNSWIITTDSSIDKSCGFELVSPILRGQNGFEEIMKVAEVLEGFKARVDSKCGFHVHVGIKPHKIDVLKRLFYLYQTFEPVIDGFMPMSRRGSANDYIKSISNVPINDVYHWKTSKSIEENLGDDRYYKLNACAFPKLGTAEFRHHSGTLEADKMINWVKFCIRMCDLAAKGLPPELKVETAYVVKDVIPKIPEWSIWESPLDTYDWRILTELHEAAEEDRWFYEKDLSLSVSYGRRNVDSDIRSFNSVASRHNVALEHEPITDGYRFKKYRRRFNEYVTNENKEVIDFEHLASYLDMSKSEIDYFSKRMVDVNLPVEKKKFSFL